MNKIFAKNLDERVLRQFANCMKEKFVVDGALMPDAHFGYVAPIGAVLITNGFVVPSWVGYDIGCGVIALKLKGKDLLEKIRTDLDLIHDTVTINVPMGLGKLNPENKISTETKEKFIELLEKLEKSPHNPDILAYLSQNALSNLGSLGHGNHFIEIDTSGKDVWLIIHCGSRHMGYHVASHYMKAAMEFAGAKGNAERTFALDVNSTLGKEYLAVQEFLLEFALLNRMEIANEVIDGLKDALCERFSIELWVNKNHNHAQQIGQSQRFIHRKGATPSGKGERGVIPGDMKNGTFLVIGKGNKKFLESSSHGAGRAMSKTQARKTTSMNEFEAMMKGIKATVKESTLDENPKAYKNIFSVMRAQEQSVKTYKHLLPILNWKGESEKRRQ